MSDDQTPRFYADNAEHHASSDSALALDEGAQGAMTRAMAQK